MQRFERPLMFDEIAGEIIQQVCMNGLVAAQAKVTGRIDQSTSKMPSPYPVDPNPGGQRIGWACDFFRHLKTSTASLKRLALITLKESQKLSRHFGTSIAGPAPLKNHRGDGLFLILQCHGPGGCSRVFGIQTFPLPLEPSDFFPPLHFEQPRKVAIRSRCSPWPSPSWPDTASCVNARC